MDTAAEAGSAGTGASARLDFDAIVIGAGVTGLYQLYKLRELGVRVRAFEAGSRVGGTWYWNRYPGARFDSESWTYGYAFSRELLNEWDWSEHFAPQPETERYLNFVADKFDLRRDIQFNTRVTAAHYREDTRNWEITLHDGSRRTTRFLVTAIGILSAPVMPNIPGVESFKGQSCHTHNWPKETVSFAGKRVGIIGTGATAVQIIQTIAKTVGHLTIFQRTPNWCAPLNNSRISTEEMRGIRARYGEILARCRETPGCYVHSTDPRSTLNTTPEERTRKIGFILQHEFNEQSRISFSMTRLMAGGLKEKPCTADYGEIGGVQSVNCRLAATTLEPSATLQYLANIPAPDRTWLSLRFSMNF